jgi:hypothetical protein
MLAAPAQIFGIGGLGSRRIPNLPTPPWPIHQLFAFA